MQLQLLKDAVWYGMATVWLQICHTISDSDKNGSNFISFQYISWIRHSSFNLFNFNFVVFDEYTLTDMLLVELIDNVMKTLKDKKSEKSSEGKDVQCNTCQTSRIGRNKCNYMLNFSRFYRERFIITIISLFKCLVVLTFSH